MKFTDEQLRQWRAYEKVRQGGRYNMYDPRAASAASLSEDEVAFVMDNYSELKTAAEQSE